MAFVAAYTGARYRDIKYIYSDQTIKFVHPVRRSFLPLQEERPLPPLKKYPKRFYDYFPAMNIGLPRAPAFRETNQDNVERIVQRVCKPIECQKTRRKDVQPEESADEEDQEDNEDSAGSETSRSNGSRGDKMTKSEMDDLLTRLQKPTESSRKKHWRERKMEDERRNAWKSQVPKLPPIDPIW